uniref:Leucine-rich repeat-containing N-terminal plant-type domain-containing protein n=1 Tax=Aegilops tauschii subsp. strangulata TaxID=200361 RepID=A0A453AGS7_AEGTS
MGSNRLDGLIPASLANMSNLQALDLSNNSHGSIPSLGSWLNLRLYHIVPSWQRCPCKECFGRQLTYKSRKI